MNWSGLPDDVFQLARHLIKKCSSSRLNQNRPLYSISVNGWKLILLPPVLPAKLQDAGRPEKNSAKLQTHFILFRDGARKLNSIIFSSPK